MRRVGGARAEARRAMDESARGRLVLASVLLAAALVLVGDARSGPGGWQTATTLTSSTRTPSIHVDGTGTVTAFMRAGSTVGAWAHAPGGQWPSSPTPLTPSGVDDGLMAVNPAGAGVVVWQNGSLLQASYRPAGGAWGPVETVSNESHLLGDVALDDVGNVVVGLRRATSTSTSVVDAVLRSVGSGWLPVDHLPVGPRENELMPAVAFESTGEAVIVWGSLTDIPSFRRVLASTRSMTGTWSTPTELSGPATQNQDISVSSNRAGTVVATWHDITTVRAAVRTGGAWGPPAVLATLSSAGSLGDIGRAAVAADGDVAALWSRFDGNASWLVEAATKPAGGSWQLPAATLSTAANGNAEPRLAGNGAGDLAAVWRENDGSSARVAAAVKPAGGSWPASPDLLSPPGVEGEWPVVAVDSTGLAAVAWIEGGFFGTGKAAFSDGGAPTAAIATPPDNATYQQGASVTADYSCADDVAGQLFSCSGPVSDGAPVDTTTPGVHAFAVTATDRAGNSTTTTHSYTVTATPALAITNVSELAGSVGRYERFEASFDLTRTYTNPVDPDQIAVDVTFTAPGGAESTMPAFWFQDYRVRPGTEAFEDYEPLGDPSWHVRFAPSQVGTYGYTIHATDGTGASATPVSGTFTVTAGSSRGFIRRDADDPLTLSFDNGDPYVPIGHNVAFEEGNPAGTSGTGYYEQLFTSLDAAGENWSRVWMTDFNRSALEWSAGHWSNLYSGVGRYSLASAWRMDEILVSAERHGVYIQLVLNDHGQFSTFTNARWHENPYSSDNGGPVPAASPHLFFSDATARELHERRLRYLVARYGAFANVLSWELFNEVQFIGTSATNMYGDPAVRAAVVAWHEEMGSTLHALDPQDHLVSTSSQPSPVDDGVSGVAAIDLLQVHLYDGPASELDRTMVGYIRDLQAAHGKPVIGGEFGLPSNPEPGFDPTTFGGSQADREHLVQGTHVHNVAWAALHARAGAGSWWWGSYIAADPANHRDAPAFPLNEAIFPPLAAYVDGEDWAAEGLSDAAITSSPTVYALGLSNGSEARAWVRDLQNGYGSGVRPGNLAGRVISGAHVAIGAMDAGTYDVEIWDTWTGTVIATSTATAIGGSLTIPLPSFTRDVAVKAHLAAAAVDSDGDGLLDEWEQNGIDADGDGIVDLALNAPPFDADPQRQDIFLEVDYMDCAVAGCPAGHTGTTHRPADGTLADVAAAFAAAPTSNPDGSTGIRLHAMLGEAVPESAPIAFTTRGAGALDDFDDYKLGGAAACDGYFGTATERASARCADILAARALAFHYVVFAHSYAEAPTSSGIAELPGNDLAVTLGGKPADWIAAAGSLRAAEAGTLMHELGHNLNLRHGGFEDVNCKPNYLSVMNYTLQVPYIDPTRTLDYSRSELLQLDERALDEFAGVGRWLDPDGLSGRYVVYGVAGLAVVAPAEFAVDWNDDGVFDPGVVADVNFITQRPDGAALPGCGSTPGGVLTGHDDWGNLRFDFHGTPDFGAGSHGSASALVGDELAAEQALDVASTVDFDGDGTPNASDNCDAAGTTDQSDLDGDGIGDACDSSNVVAIDISPGNKKNVVRPNSAERVFVAILAGAGFDPTKRVDRASLTFGRSGDEASLHSCEPVSKDVNGDRRPDLVCGFTARKTGFKKGDTVGVLKGRTVAGAAFRGTDSVVVE